VALRYLLDHHLSYCQPVACSRRPPVAKAELGARGNDPVEDHQSDVGPHGCRSVRASRPDHLIDDLATRWRLITTGSCEVTEARCWSARDRCLTCHCSLDVSAFPSSAPRPSSPCRPPWPSGAVVIALPVDLLRDDGSHALGNTPSGDKSRALTRTFALVRSLFGRKSFRKAQPAHRDSQETAR